MMRQGIEMLRKTLPQNLLQALEIKMFNRQMHKLGNKILLPAKLGFFTPNGKLQSRGHDLLCYSWGLMNLSCPESRVLEMSKTRLIFLRTRTRSLRVP